MVHEMSRGVWVCLVLTCFCCCSTGHLLNRIHVIIAGCLLWALMTLLFSFARWVPDPLLVGCILWSFNGLGQALVIPNTQSLMADYHKEENRGKAFGCLYSVSSFGAIVGSIYATNVSGMNIGSLEGWQLVMFTLAAVSVVTAILNAMFGKDPRDISGFIPEEELKENSWKDTLSSIWFVLRIPTFIILILQGFVGSIPWIAAATYTTLFLQLIGMSDVKASVIQGLFLCGDGLGGLLGGYLGDKAGRFWPHHGRIAVGQISILAGVPLSAILFQGLPRNGEFGTFVLYMVLFFIHGLVISWPVSACNSPLFADVVPVRMRNLSFAFDRCFENGLAAMSSFFVGWAASFFFGYEGLATPSGDPALDSAKAVALGKALTWFSTVPWTLCALLYSGLHFTYRRDKVRAPFQPLLEASLSQQGI